MPDPKVPADLDLGHVKEGVVEIDPMTGRMTLRSENASKGLEFFDVQEALMKYEGQEVRVVIVPFSTIDRVAELVDGGMPVDAVPKAGGDTH